MLNKCFFIQIWNDQKNVKTDTSNKMTTQEYFDKEKEMSDNIVKANIIGKAVDVEKQKIKDEMKIMAIKEKNYNQTLVIMCTYVWNYFLNDNFSI